MLANPTTPARSRALGATAVVLSLLAVAVPRSAFSKPDDAQATDPLAQGRPLTPAGSLVMDATTRMPAVGALATKFVRSPDGRYLVVVNSGYGIRFNESTNEAQQSLAVLDLQARPAPAVVQNVYFPTPQSANVGAAFAPKASSDGSVRLYVSGGFQNKVWMFRFVAGRGAPISPASNGPSTEVTAPFVDVGALASSAPRDEYNSGLAPVYPVGLALGPDGTTLFVANNLGDSLGVVSELDGARRLARVDLRREGRDTYPYDVAVVPGARGAAGKVYVSLWNDASVAVVNPARLEAAPRFVAVGRHPTALMLAANGRRLFVVNSDDDSVSVLDTATDAELERISTRLAEGAPLGNSPEGVALSEDGRTMYVANAHSNSVAVVALSARAAGATEGARPGERSTVRGFIPTGRYPSAIAVANGALFVGNGKGTGFESSSLVVNGSGRAPNVANDRFPAAGRRGGQYILSLVSGNLSAIPEPEAPALAQYTQDVMRHNGLVGSPAERFRRPPIRHVIYVIRENRTYDQIFGDLERSGDGTRADGDPTLAIFGAGDAARRPGGAAQNVTPNARALALRFGLFDRFFVNSEASPDGHNWSTAAFSTDYVDKAYRWNYSGRGRTYDFEGFNRLPDYEPVSSTPSLFPKPTTSDDIASFLKRFVPYLNGSRDVGEPQSLYLWDAAARAGLTYRTFGEFVATVSAADVTAINANEKKAYPDVSETVAAVPTKRALEGHHSRTFRAFDMASPDAMTAASYRAAVADPSVDPLVSREHRDARCRGVSRIGEWLAEFRSCVADREAGKPDRLPSLTLLRLVSDHTAGVSAGMATPQFMVADNDYALGRLVQAVSGSPYWKDTAIFVLEDDAQDGPDHVDAHRSPSLVISAYTRPGALVHEFHTTVSLIRTIQLLLGIPPMNQLDAAATPMDVFQAEPDLRPFAAILPVISSDNLVTPPPADRAARYWAERTAEQDLAHADVADPLVLNRAIWFSVRGAGDQMPLAAHLPAFDALREGIRAQADGEEDEDRVARKDR